MDENTFTLEELPTEVFDLIIEPLSSIDLKSIRLTCKRFEILAARRLFRKAGMSFLRTDRDAFFGISSSPHLRTFVEELVWYECPLYIPQNARYYPLDEGIEDTQRISLYQEALWLPVNSHVVEGDTVNEIDPKYLDGPFQVFLYEFSTALKTMPRLHTVISETVPLDRILTNACYPLTTRLLAWSDLKYYCHGFLIMLKALLDAELGVKSLRWVERDFDTLNGGLLSLTSPGLEKAFEPLYNIDIHLRLLRSHHMFPRLALCLQAATKLRNLCLSTEDCGDGYFMFSDLVHRYSWLYLSSLTLAELRIQEQEFLSFIKRHAKTLHQLSLDRCTLSRHNSDTEGFSEGFPEGFLEELPEGCWSDLFHSMTRIKGLRLDSFHFTSPTGEETRVNDQELLRFINGDEPTLPDALWKNLCLRTHTTIFDDHDWFNHRAVADIRGCGSFEDDTSVYTVSDIFDDNTSWISDASIDYEGSGLSRPFWTIHWVNGSIVFWSILPEELEEYRVLKYYET